MSDESQSLQSIARDIAREHALAQEAAASALEHARACGELLTEAKGRVGHGGWGAWLGEHFPASARTAQRYMTIAERWEELAGKATRVSDLPIREAARLLAEPKEEEGRLFAEMDDRFGLPPGWARSRIEGPIDGWDCEVSRQDVGWIGRRLLGLIGVPVVARFFLGMWLEYGISGVLRVVPGDELGEAVRRLAGFLGDEVAGLIDTRGMTLTEAQFASLEVRLACQRWLGVCFGELEEREALDDAEFTRQRRDAYAAITARLNAEVEELEAAS